MVISANAEWGLKEDAVLDSLDREQASKYFYMPAYEKALECLHSASPQKPEVEFEYPRAEKDKLITYKVRMLCIYGEDRISCVNVIGKINKTERGLNTL